MDFIKDDPANLSHNLGSSIEHRSQDFGCHHQAGRRGIDSNIPRHQSHIAKVLAKLPIFLIAESFYWTCVYDSLIVLQTLCDSVLSDNSLSSTSVRRNQHAFTAFYGCDCDLLEGI